MPRKRTKVVPGQRYTRLVVLLEDIGRSASGLRRWLCQCDCGATHSVVGADLARGHTKSCGCLGREYNEPGARGNPTHGLARDTACASEYKIWKGMRQRCSNPNTAEYRHYGERGIAICARWQDFENFLADMGPRPSPQHSIDRIDVDGDYEPGNCRWATPVEQNRNTRSNVNITYGGRTQTLAAWAEEIGVEYMTMYSRLRRANWTLERALTTPTCSQGRRRTVLVQPEGQGHE